MSTDRELWEATQVVAREGRPMSESLRECPFCGGAPAIWSGHLDGYQVRCGTESCAVHTADFVTEQGAISAWNRRAAPDHVAPQQVSLGESASDLAADRTADITVELAAGAAPPSVVGRKMTIDELEKLLNSETDAAITILPNGEVRAATEEEIKQRKEMKPLTMREKLGGEYSKPEPAIRPTHEAADAFWAYWKANGETHKHGYYESTWGAINSALRTSGVVMHDYHKLPSVSPQAPTANQPSGDSSEALQQRGTPAEGADWVRRLMKLREQVLMNNGVHAEDAVYYMSELDSIIRDLSAAPRPDAGEGLVPDYRNGFIALLALALRFGFFNNDPLKGRVIECLERSQVPSNIKFGEVLDAAIAQLEAARALGREEEK